MLAVVPLQRLAPVYPPPPLSTDLLRVGAWIPSDLHLAALPYISRQDTGYLELMGLIALLYLAYGAGAVATMRHATYHRGEGSVLTVIGLGALAGGTVLAMTPGLLATDIYSYAAYGRLLLAHHANPFFVPPAAYPHDPVYPYLYWKGTLSIYGPLWVGACALLMMVSGSGRMEVILSFRALALLAHLVNALLVARILGALRRPPPVVALGTLLYAWNPLVLFESAYGGHNDVVMLTFVLLGLWWCARAEQRGDSRPGAAAMPALPLALATLVKYSALPVLALYLVLVARGAARQHGPRAAVSAAGAAALLAAAVIAACFAPFLEGHGVLAYFHTFATQVSTTRDYNSLLVMMKVWHHLFPLPGAWAALATHQLWSIVDGAGVLVSLLGAALWLWRVPTTRTLALGTLGVLGTFLLLTPWFFPWYVTWMVGLAAVALPVAGERRVAALLGLTLAFSATALLTYYSLAVGWLLLTIRPPQAGWAFAVYPATFGLPLLIALASLPRPAR
ncbi:MAG: hypothetical protein NVSMB65_02800 [Chloroflexota bacterium]